MGYLSNIGRIFYGLAIAAIGYLTVYYHDFSYMLIPRQHDWVSSHTIIAYISGAFLFLTGAWIVFGKMIMSISLLLGTVLLLVFCFYFVPYEFIVSTNFIHFADWENAIKELTLSSGAFLVAGCFTTENKGPFIRFLQKLVPVGAIIFPLAILSFGIDHFLYGKEAVDYIPSCIPGPMFWMYFCGVALIGSSIGIILKIKPRLMATLLGTMIFIWVIILHIPKAMAAPNDDQSGEVTSALIALAYCGIAFVIAGKTTRSGYNGLN